MKILGKIFSVFILTILLISGVNAKTRYKELSALTSPTRNVKLYINVKDENLDLKKRNNIQLRLVRPKQLLVDNETTGNIELVLYDVASSTRNFINSTNLSVGSARTKAVNISVDLGYFQADQKDLEIDLYDATGSIVATYPLVINAINREAQVSVSADPNRDYSCDVNDIEACIESYLLTNVSFSAVPKKQASTSVEKNPITDKLEITLPYSRRFRYFNGSRRKINLKVNDQFSESSVAELDELSLNQIVLRDVNLQTNLTNGAIEYANNNFYFTFNGQRVSLNDLAGSGPQGPQGIQGPQGPQGPSGTLANGAVINGPVIFTNNGSFQFPKAADDGYLWTSDANGNATWKKPAENTITPVGISDEIDINGITSIDVSGYNFIRLIDSDLATVDTLSTITGGTMGQRISIQLKSNDLFFDLNTNHDLNTIQWGRGNILNPRRQQKSEIFSFLYDGNAWYLVDRFTL